MSALHDYLERAIVKEGRGIYTIDGDVLTVEIVGGRHRGARRRFNLRSELLVKNLEELDIFSTVQERHDLEYNPAKYREEQFKKAEEALLDSRGNKFDPKKHEVDDNGRPVLTKFKTFKKKS